MRPTRLFLATLVVSIGLSAALGACGELAPPDAGTLPKDEVLLADALDQRLAEVEITGTGAASGASIKLRIRRLVQRELAIGIPPGSALLNGNASEQDMVVRQPLEQVLLTDDDWHQYTLEAYCLEAHAENPSEGSQLALGELPNPDVKAVLLAIDRVPDAEGNVKAIQAAVWAVTDDVSRSELEDVGYDLSSDDLDTGRALIENAGLDPASFRLFRDF